MLRPEVIRAARALLRWTRAELASKAGLSEATVKAIQVAAEPTGSVRTHRKLFIARERAGIELIDDRRTGRVGAVLHLPSHGGEKAERLVKPSE